MLGISHPWSMQLNQAIVHFFFVEGLTYHMQREVGNKLAKRSFAELPLQCLELVGKLGPPNQSHQLQFYQAIGRAPPLEINLFH